MVKQVLRDIFYFFIENYKKKLEQDNLNVEILGMAQLQVETT